MASRGKRVWTVATAVLAMGLGGGLVGCSGPMDRGLNTQTLTAYRASLDPVYAQMSAHEKAAFDWAVSDLELATLHARYPNGSPREVIRGEVQAVLAEYPKLLEGLQAQSLKQAPLRAELAKVTATGRFAIEKDFFGLQPVVTAEIFNGSRYPISQLSWDTKLYLNGSSDPVAASTVTSDFRSRTGLGPGEQRKARFTIGFVKGDERWTSLEVRNAHSISVVLTPMLTTIRDFGDRPYLTIDAARKVKSTQAAIDAAKSYADL